MSVHWLQSFRRKNVFLFHFDFLFQFFRYYFLYEMETCAKLTFNPFYRRRLLRKSDIRGGIKQLCVKFMQKHDIKKFTRNPQELHGYKIVYHKKRSKNIFILNLHLLPCKKNVTCKGQTINNKLCKKNLYNLKKPCFC